MARRKIDRIISRFLAVLILLNVLAVILETVPSLRRQFENQFFLFEFFSVAIFTVEYLIRVWAAAEKNLHNTFKARLRYMFSPLALIDLLSIMPFYLPFVANFDLRTLRALRLLRLVRVFKMGRYSKSLQSLGTVLHNKTPDLIVSLSVGFMLIVISASVMYFFENEAQPDSFPSIPAAMWWAVSTLTTVGYGDVYPHYDWWKNFWVCDRHFGCGLNRPASGDFGCRPDRKC